MLLFTKENLLHFTKEIIWLCLTFAAIYAVLYPVISKIDFIYWKENVFFIFIAITFFRWTVTFSSLPFLKPTLIRFLLFTINLSLFIFIFHHLRKFIELADNFYIEDFGFPKVIMYEDIKNDMFKYLYNELVLTGTGALVTIVALQFRLIISYWQYYQHAATKMLED